MVTCIYATSGEMANGFFPGHIVRQTQSGTQLISRFMLNIGVTAVAGAGLIRQMLADEIQRGCALRATVELVEINQG